MRSSILMIVFSYLLIITSILVYHYYKLKKTIEVRGEIISASSEKTERGRMTFSISKTKVKYSLNRKVYVSEFDTDLLKTFKNDNVCIICVENEPEKSFINTYKGKWSEKIYLVLFISISVTFLCLMLNKN